MAAFPEIPGYQIEKELGQGGMARVYLAHEEKLERHVALKVLLPSFCEIPHAVERFITEAKTAARLVHANIVTVHNVGSFGDIHYMAVEYIPGGSLKDKISRTPLAVAEALDIIYQVASALQYAHEKGFIHRDIKPDNILFRRDGTAVLTDFGIARAVDSAAKMTKAGMSIGTPHYMSPEQARGKTVDGRSDLYALGIVLFEMLTGRVPYDAEDSVAVAIQHIQEPVPVLPVKLGKCQPLLKKLLAKNPLERFQTAGELQMAILELPVDAFHEAPLQTDVSSRSFRAKKTPSRSRPVVTNKEVGAYRGILEKKPINLKNPLVRWLTALLALLVLVLVWVILQSQKSGSNAISQQVVPYEQTQAAVIAAEARRVEEQRSAEAAEKKRLADELKKKQEEEQQAAIATQRDQEEANQLLDWELEDQQQMAAEKKLLVEASAKKKKEERDRQRLMDEQKEAALKEKELAAARIAEENRQKTLSINFSELDSKLAQEYVQNLQRIIIPDVPPEINAFGQVTTLININASGKISMSSLLDRQSLTVDPLSQQDTVKKMIVWAFARMSFLPPRDHNGEVVVLEKWRVSFKVITLSGKITLIKQ